MKRNLLSVLLLFFISSIGIKNLAAQNLVLNPDFETINTACAFSGYGSMTNWYLTDTCSSPDRFSSCSLFQALLGAPANGQGNQAPHSGTAYAGFISYDNSSGSSAYREYVEGKLSTPLVAGQSYCVGFYISLADNSPIAVNRLGVYFANTQPFNNLHATDCIGTSTTYPATPQLQAPTAITDKTNWVLVQWTYVATGGELYFIIGNFYNNANTTTTSVGGGVSAFSYYYIDDVSVTTGACSLVAANATGTNASCNGQCNGTATANLSSGTGTITYHWSNNGTTQTISSLCAGTYTVTATDALANSATASYTVTQPAAVTVNTSSTSTTCGNNNGSATATPNGGSATYVWNNGLTTQTISNVAAGNYTVTVTSSGCSVTASAMVASSTGISASASSTNTGCTNTGTATVSITGGTASTYVWNNGGSTSTISNLAVGNYTVTVTAVGNCSATASTTVAATGTNVTLTTSATNAGCAATGTATVNTTAGTAPFTYNWSSGATTQTASNLSAGNYQVTVTGSGNCTATASVTVGSAGSGVVLSPSSVNASCGNNNGTASITVTSGTAPYTYIWNNGGTASSILNVPSGTYTVTVTGSGNCTATASVTVSSTNGVALSTSSNNAGCTSTGSATVTTTAGTGPFGYLWNNGATTQTALNLSAGTYTVTVTGSGNCTATASVTISSSGGITLSSTFTNTTCGNNNGSASVNAVGGSGVYSYNWSNGASTAALANLPSGTYTVTVNDNAGCSSTASTIVNPSGNGTVHITRDDSIMCAGDSIRVCIDNPDVNSTYLWNHAQTTTCIYAKTAGNYYVTVTDAGNCTASSNHVPINVYPLPQVSISVNGDTMTAYNAVTYQWFYNGTLLPGANGHIYIATQTGNYTLAISDVNGCVAVSNPVTIATVGISQIIEGEQLRVYPNPLENGYWTLENGEHLIGHTIELFDDNGRLVYQTKIQNLKSKIEFNAASGIYMMKISGAKHAVTLKLIKL